jgi:hypothetical protein
MEYTVVMGNYQTYNNVSPLLEQSASSGRNLPNQIEHLGSRIVARPQASNAADEKFPEIE